MIFDKRPMGIGAIAPTGYDPTVNPMTGAEQRFADGGQVGISDPNDPYLNGTLVGPSPGYTVSNPRIYNVNGSNPGAYVAPPTDIGSYIDYLNRKFQQVNTYGGTGNGIGGVGGTGGGARGPIPWVSPSAYYGTNSGNTAAGVGAGIGIGSLLSGGSTLVNLLKNNPELMSKIKDTFGILTPPPNYSKPAGPSGVTEQPTGYQGSDAELVKNADGSFSYVAPVVGQTAADLINNLGFDPNNPTSISTEEFDFDNGSSNAVGQDTSGLLTNTGDTSYLSDPVYQNTGGTLTEAQLNDLIGITAPSESVPSTPVDTSTQGFDFNNTGTYVDPLTTTPVTSDSALAYSLNQPVEYAPAPVPSYADTVDWGTLTDTQSADAALESALTPYEPAPVTTTVAPSAPTETLAPAGIDFTAYSPAASADSALAYSLNQPVSDVVSAALPSYSGLTDFGSLSAAQSADAALEAALSSNASTAGLGSLGDISANIDPSLLDQTPNINIEPTSSLSNPFGLSSLANSAASVGANLLGTHIWGQQEGVAPMVTSAILTAVGGPIGSFFAPLVNEVLFSSDQPPLTNPLTGKEVQPGSPEYNTLEEWYTRNVNVPTAINTYNYSPEDQARLADAFYNPTSDVGNVVSGITEGATGITFDPMSREELAQKLGVELPSTTTTQAAQEPVYASPYDVPGAAPPEKIEAQAAPVYEEPAPVYSAPEPVASTYVEPTPAYSAPEVATADPYTTSDYTYNWMEDPMVLYAMNLYGYAGGGAVQRYAGGGGIGSLPRSPFAAGGKFLRGDGDGMSDSIPAVIEGEKPQQAALADGEFVVPADVVSHLGNGSSEAGSRKLYEMMDKVRMARTGTKQQGKQINPNKFLPV